MERSGRPAAPGGVPSDALEVGPAIRDAAAILARATADEAAATEARDRYRTGPMATLEADGRIAPLLATSERVLAQRRGVVFDRRQTRSGPDVPVGLVGDLYLTSRRLVLIGRLTLSFDLDEIDQAMLAGERLLLVMRGGLGVSLDVGQPRLLRVEIGAARAAARG